MRAVLEKNSVVGKTAPEPVWKSATGFARTEQTTGPPDLPAFPHHWLIPAVWNPIGQLITPYGIGSNLFLILHSNQSSARQQDD